MRLAIFDTETEKLEYLANLLNQDVKLTFNQVIGFQSELDKVGFYR